MRYWKFNRGGSSSYLMHHGVEGQRWGVRHGPPYPIQDTILRKGTKLNSVSTTKKSSTYKNRGRMMYTYRPDDQVDTQIYRGPFTRFLRSGWSGGNIKTKVFDHSFETLRDLKMPTSKQRIDEFIKMYNSSTGKKRKTFTDELNEMMLYVKNEGSPISDKVGDYNLATFKEDKDYGDYKIAKTNLNATLSGKSAESAYALFNALMEESHGYEITREYVKNVSNKWDAMVDDFNVGIYNGAHDPIIIFDPATDLVISSKKDKGRFISVREMQRNTDEVKKRNGGRYVL